MLQVVGSLDDRVHCRSKCAAEHGLIMMKFGDEMLREQSMTWPHSGIGTELGLSVETRLRSSVRMMGAIGRGESLDGGK